MAGVAAVASIFGAYSTATAQRKASKQAEAAAVDEQDMARQEAAAIESETVETTRRAMLKAEKTEGISRAKAAASGLTMSGSIESSLLDMSEEHSRQIDWMAKAGAAKARLAIQGGEMRASAQTARADQLQAQMWGTVASGVGTGYSGGKDAGWWG